MSNHRILLVDDDILSLKLLKAVFDAEGFTTYTATDGREALPVLMQERIDLVITDILMPNVDGYYLCYKIRSTPSLKDIPIIVYSGTFTAEGEEKIARGMGADLFIRKPAGGKVIVNAVEELLQNPQLHTAPEAGIGTSFEVLHQYSSELIDKLEKRNLALEETKRNLEKLVAERTQRLDIANDELRTSIEELQAANEEIAASNEELNSANEELQTLNDQLSMAADTIHQQSEIIIRQKDEALKRSEQNLKVIFANTIEEIAVLDNEGRVVLFNKTLETFILLATGKKPEIGMYVWDMTIQERKVASRQLFNRAVKGESIEVETIVTTSKGEVIHLIRYTPVFVDDQIAYVTLISTDITEKKKQELLLKQSEQNLQTIFRNTNDLFLLLDVDLTILAFNANYLQVMHELGGLKLEVGHPLLSKIPFDRIEKFKQLIDEVNKQGSITYETHYGPASEEHWFEVGIKLIKDNNEIITGYCITAHNITNLKKYASEIFRLNKTLSNFQQAIYSSSMASTTDANGIITFVNDNTLAVNGYSREEFIGQNFRILNSGYHPKTFWMNMWQTISSGKTWTGRIRNKKKNGSFFWVDAFIIPFLDETNSVYQYLTIRHDITAQKEAEDKLIQSQILLEESSKIAKVGCWVLDKKTKRMEISREMLEIFETGEEEFLLDQTILYKRVHPEDVNKVISTEQLFSSKEPFIDTEYRLLGSDGSITWIYQKADLTKVINEEEKIIGIVQNITERKITEEALLEYNERYEILSKATNDAIWDMNITTQNMVWNHAFFSIFGYRQQDIEYSGNWWQGKIHRDDIEQTLIEFDLAVRRNQTNWNAYYRMQCADGSYKHVYNRCYILYDNGQAIRAIGSLQDVTERIESVKEIEKLSLVASSTKNAVIISDRQGLIDWVNESFTKMTGYQLSEVKGMKPKFLQGTETDPMTIKRISNKLKTCEFVSEEIVNYTKSGHKYWSKLDIAPVFDEHQQLKNFISIQSDISELKEYEKSIISIAKELASLIENANVPIFGIDNEGHINEWNQVAAQLTGYSRKEVMGVAWIDSFISLNNIDKMTTMVNHAMNEQSSTNVEFPVFSRENQPLTLLLSASPRRNTSNQIIGIIFVGQNITELTDYRHNLEQMVEDRTRELNIALSKEKELVQMKSQFISIASHEFRTPLTSIKLASGFIKKYREKITGEVIDKKMENIEKQVNNMTYLLDDILMIGKAEAGKLPVTKKEVDLVLFLHTISREVEKNSGHTHHIKIHHELTTTVLKTDEKLLRNIFINLLTNAIKFSPDATTVSITILTQANAFYVKVKDEGLGIPEEDIKNLFEPFFRGGNATSIQGTGLGLSIIKKAVDLLNGKITLKSIVGKGTEIEVELPAS